MPTSNKVDRGGQKLNDIQMAVSTGFLKPSCILRVNIDQGMAAGEKIGGGGKKLNDIQMALFTGPLKCKIMIGMNIDKGVTCTK